jgi:hypothetical protein
LVHRKENLRERKSGVEENKRIVIESTGLYFSVYDPDAASCILRLHSGGKNSHDYYATN